MWACEPKGILSRYFTGIIYYASQCWQSYAIVFRMQQNSFAKFVVDSVSLAQWQAKLKEGGRNQGSTFFPPYLFLHVFDLYLFGADVTRSIASRSSFDSQMGDVSLTEV